MSLIGGPASYWPSQREELRVSRIQLYELAWSAPMRQLAEELGVSDSGLAKALRQHDIPLPPAGYWNKLRAGKPANRPQPPVRKAGQHQLLHVHGTLAERFKNEPAEPDNPDGPFATPAVPEDLEQLRLDTLAILGPVKVPRTLDGPHAALLSLFRRDERRRAKIVSSSYPTWEAAPLFELPSQVRKLRIANALMLSLAQLGHRCELWGEREPSFRAKVGDQDVQVQIHHRGEPFPASLRHGDPPPPTPKAPLCVEVLGSLPKGLLRLWQDGEQKLESSIAEIAAAVVAAGEARYRLGISERLERIAEWERRQEEQRQRALAKRNQERLAALHRSAELLRASQDLRALIASVAAAVETGRKDLEKAALDKWRAWAEAEADRIDPVMSGQVNEHLLETPPAP